MTQEDEHDSPDQESHSSAGKDDINHPLQDEWREKARKLPTDMQRKLAMCQRRKGRTCRNSQRISEGIHENMGPASLRTRNTALAEEIEITLWIRRRFHILFKMFAIPTIEKTSQQLAIMELWHNRAGRSEFHPEPIHKAR